MNRTSDAASGILSPAAVAPNRSYEPVKRGQRRIYETPAQKDAEYAMVSEFAYALSLKRGYGLVPKALSGFESMDYTLHAMDPKIFNEPPSRVHAAVECKSHNHPYGTYSQYILDMKNWQKMKNMAQWTHVYLLVAYTNGYYYLDFSADAGSIDFQNQISLHAGGRTDRNDPNDIVLKVNFPVTYIKPLDVIYG